MFRTATINANEYHYSDTSGTHWVWNQGGGVTWDTWQSLGNDTDGTLSK